MPSATRERNHWLRFTLLTIPILRARTILMGRISSTFGWTGLLLPVLILLLRDFSADGIPLSEVFRIAQQVMKRGEILGEDEKTGFSDFIRVLLPVGFSQHQIMIAVAGLFHLRDIGARADGLEELLEENGLILRRLDAGC